MKYSPIVFTLVAIFLPAVAFAEAARTFQELAADVVEILDATTAVLIVAGIVVYFWGISTNILNFSDDAAEKVRTYFFWGIIVLFVMVSIWGIVNLLESTLFPAGAGGDGIGPAAPSQSKPLSSFPTSS